MVEHGVSLSKGVDEGIQVSIKHQRTCHDALPALDDDRIQVADILCAVGVAHIVSHLEVDRLFAVEEVEDGGCQLDAKMFKVDIQVREMFLTDEPHLIDLGVQRISISHRLERGHFSILRRSSTNSGITYSRIPSGTMQEFHGAASRLIAHVTVALTNDRKLGWAIGAEPHTTRC